MSTDDTSTSAEPAPTASGPLPGDWQKSAVVYQIYPRSFADSDGDGVGDLPGALQRLDHLADLGVDVVWLSPVYRSPMDDNGYDISDYDDIDPLFGSLADLDALIAGLHERGIKLIMDLVVNHTSDEHPWFVEARLGTNSSKRDWYWWRPPRPGFHGGTPSAEPTNWASFFSGPAWEWDEESGEYYLHLFSRKQPDLNWETPQVREAVYAMMRRWLDRGVDGFRMDVINLISKDVRPNGELAGGQQLPGEGLGDGTPMYMAGPRIHEFVHEMHTQIFQGREGALLTVGEMPGVSLEQARLFTDPARRAVDMVFQFERAAKLAQMAKNRPIFRKLNGSWWLVGADLSKGRRVDVTTRDGSTRAVKVLHVEAHDPAAGLMKTTFRDWTEAGEQGHKKIMDFQADTCGTPKPQRTIAGIEYVRLRVDYGEEKWWRIVSQTTCRRADYDDEWGDETTYVVAEITPEQAQAIADDTAAHKERDAEQTRAKEIFAHVV